MADTDQEYKKLNHTKSVIEDKQKRVSSEIDELEDENRRLTTAYGEIEAERERMQSIKGSCFLIPDQLNSVWKGSKATEVYTSRIGEKLCSAYAAYISKLKNIEESIQRRIDKIERQISEKQNKLYTLNQDLNDVMEEIYGL